MASVATAQASVAATQASAATLAVSAPCYVNATPARGTSIDVTGTGYTPGDTIAVQGRGIGVNGQGSATTTAGADGSINLVTTGPVLPFTGPGVRSITLTSQDETSAAGNLAQTAVRVANFSVDTLPSVASPSRKVTWRFSGFRPGHSIYIHYLHRGKVLERMAFGRAQGPCGTLKARKKLYPGGHPHFGTYQVVFDQIERYTRRARPRISTTLKFF